MEYSSGTQGNTEIIYRLYLFDVRMFTKLTFSNTEIWIFHLSRYRLQMVGDRLKVLLLVITFVYKGVHPTITTDPTILVTNVVGTFSIGEKITVSDSLETDDILEDDGNTDLTITDVVQ